MFRKWKIVLVGALGLLINFLVGGEKPGIKPTHKSKPQPKYSHWVLAYSTPSFENQFWQRVTKGVKEKAKQAHIEIRIFDAQGNPAKQLADIEDAIQKKVDAILISPYESDSATPAVKAANKAKIPVIVVDIGVKGGKYETFIISDNTEGGRIAGRYIAKRLKGKRNPKVAHIQCQLGAANAQKRGKGFEEIMKKEKIKVVARQPADSRRDLGMSVMENILQAHPDIDAVFCQNDEMALGALQALEQAGKKKRVILVGFDGNPDALKAIKAGRLDATVSQKPEEMGKLGVESALKVLQGKKVKKEILVPVELVTKETLEKKAEREKR